MARTSGCFRDTLDASSRLPSPRRPVPRSPAAAQSSADSSYFLSFRCSVARLMPRARAARDTLWAETSSAWTNARRSTSASGTTPCVAGMPTAEPCRAASAEKSCGGRLLSCSTCVVSSRTARPMALSSSRTLPGQSCCSSRCSA